MLEIIHALGHDGHTHAAEKGSLPRGFPVPTSFLPPLSYALNKGKGFSSMYKPRPVTPNNVHGPYPSLWDHIKGLAIVSPCNREVSAIYLASCVHRPSLVPIKWLSEISGFAPIC